MIECGLLGAFPIIGEAPTSGSNPVAIARRTGPVQTYAIGVNPAPSSSGTIILTVAAGYLLELVSLEVSLALAVGGANRLPLLQFDDSATVKLSMPGADGDQAPNSTCRYRWVEGAPYTGIRGTTPNLEATAHWPPGIKLYPGYNLRLSLPGVQTGDDLNAALITLREFRQ